MYSYIKGIVTEIDNNYIVVDNNGVGYKVYTASPYSFNINDTYKVYLYQYVKEDEISLYGFKDKTELDLFLKLINVKGLGCKMALPMFATGSTNGIIDAIERENILYLKKFPKIGEKLARQIILDLKGKLVGGAVETDTNDELIEALMALGYKSVDIKKAISNIDKKLTIEMQIKEALKLMLR